MHSAYKRIVPGAKTAVLMIHGICGTPNHFRNLLPLQALVPQDCSVHNMVLPGHCRGVSEFAKSSMQEWKAAAWQAFEELCCTHQQVVLVGHSLGTLLAIDMALERPEKIPFLFLIAVPLRVGIKGFAVRNILRLAFDRLDHSDPRQAAMVQVCGLKPTKNLFRYIPWLPRMLELIRLMHRTSRKLDGICVPAIAFQSHPDEMVSRHSRKLLEKCGRLEVHELRRSTHFYYGPEDVKTVQERFLRAWKNYIGGEIG